MKSDTNDVYLVENNDAGLCRRECKSIVFVEVLLEVM